MRQEFFEAGDGMFGDAGEYVVEPGKRIDFHEFARGYEAAQHGRSSATVVASEKVQLFRLCTRAHNRNYAQSAVMRSS